MPKNIKAVPPQQSSLKEIWGGKKLKNMPADASLSAKEEYMEVDDVKSETGKNCIILLGKS